MDYIAETGARFSFDGFCLGDDPLTHFDAQRYAKALHGVVLLVYLFTPCESQYKYLADDGLIHELIHLVEGICICSHNSMSSIRSQIEELMHVYYEAESYYKTQETRHPI